MIVVKKGTSMVSTAEPLFGLSTLQQLFDHAGPVLRYQTPPK